MTREQLEKASSINYDILNISRMIKGLEDVSSEEVMSCNVEPVIVFGQVILLKELEPHVFQSIKDIILSSAKKRLEELEREFSEI